MASPTATQAALTALVVAAFERLEKQNPSEVDQIMKSALERIEPATASASAKAARELVDAIWSELTADRK